MAGGAWPLSYVSSGRKAAKLHRSTLTLPAFSLPAPLALDLPVCPPRQALGCMVGAWALLSCLSVSYAVSVSYETGFRF